MPSWNAYKVFASGKRAKMPYTTFDSEDSKHFYESILPTLTPKLQKSNWLILNTEEPQERQAEAIDEAKVKFQKDKIRFLGTLAAKKYPKFANKKVEACLSMCPETEWKWAWCVVECAVIGTLANYLKDLIPAQGQIVGSGSNLNVWRLPSTQDWRFS